MDKTKTVKWATFLNPVENHHATEVTEYLFQNKLIDKKSRYAVVKYSLMYIYDEMLDVLEEEYEDGV